MPSDVHSLLNGIFWTEPPENEDSRTNDPLGLDAMREGLSNKLVSCLTGRTWWHEDFFWTLVFLQWGKGEPSDKARETNFLYWERCLKLYWIKYNPSRRFPGIKAATDQANENDAPTNQYRRLLKNPRSQGMLGAHVGPLRKLRLLNKEDLKPTPDGETLVEGVGEPISLKGKDGNWNAWKQTFKRAGKAYGEIFRKSLRTRLWNEMPDLRRSLAALNWRKTPSWGLAGTHLGPQLRPCARLADEFCSWADELRAYFDDLVQLRGKDPTVPFPSRLRTIIPLGLKHWDPLRKALKRWDIDSPKVVLANLHKDVFKQRGYGRGDLWLAWEDNQITAFPSRGDRRPSNEGSDCRWSNAVALMKPGD